MKKILLTMVALLSMTAVMAQDGDKKERRAPKMFTAEEMTDRMANDLELTAEQKAKVLDLNKEFTKDQQTQMKEREKAREKAREKQMEKRKEFGEKRKAYDEKLKSILTPEQYKKYQEQHKGGHHGRRGHQGGPRGPRPAGFPED